MRQVKGFTLIEMLVVLVLLGLLVSMAYPAYTNYVLKSRRSDAHTALYTLAAQMERYFTEHNSYQNVSLAKLGFPEISPNGFYRLAILNPQLHTYQLSATPIASQKNDTICGTLMLSQSGKKSISGTGNKQTCW